MFVPLFYTGCARIHTKFIAYSCFNGSVGSLTGLMNVTNQTNIFSTFITFPVPDNQNNNYWRNAVYIYI